MKQLYLLRHGEITPEGLLTESAKEAAIALGKTLPRFSNAISSDTPRAAQTAALLAIGNPKIDERAGFYAPAGEKGRDIYQFGVAKSLDFFEAAEQYQNGELAKGILDKALGMLELIDETLSRMEDGQTALIVSHDLTITTAMALKDMPKTSSNYLSGYVISDEGSITKFLP